MVVLGVGCLLRALSSSEASYYAHLHIYSSKAWLLAISGGTEELEEVRTAVHL